MNPGSAGSELPDLTMIKLTTDKTRDGAHKLVTTESVDEDNSYVDDNKEKKSALMTASLPNSNVVPSNDDSRPGSNTSDNYGGAYNDKAVS